MLIQRAQSADTYKRIAPRPLKKEVARAGSNSNASSGNLGQSCCEQNRQPVAQRLTPLIQIWFSIALSVVGIILLIKSIAMFLSNSAQTDNSGSGQQEAYQLLLLGLLLAVPGFY